jgi:hypothetical protein
LVNLFAISSGRIQERYGIAVCKAEDLNAFDRVPDDQHNHCADNGDQQAVQVESSYAGMPKRIEQPSANHGADNAQYEVEQQSLAALVDDLASDKSS